MRNPSRTPAARTPAALALMAVWLLWSCSGAREPQPAPTGAPTGPARSSGQEALQERIRQLEEELRAEQEAAAKTARENQELRRQLGEKQSALASIEERYATLEIELASAMEEMIRSEASVRGVRSRALATSRISEVRVQLGTVPNTEDREVAARVDRARDFLIRADRALEEENYGGASFLAERAAELIRQARIVGEIRASFSNQPVEIIPIVPPRQLVVTANANLRRGPGLTEARVGGLQPGDRILAVARSGEWYQVRLPSDVEAWIHGSLVRQESP